jgi:dTDP-4-dehydrorhamnose reductase
VDDQISSPTWARALAEATAQIIAQGRGAPVDYIREKSGLYHLAGGGSCSRYEWAKAALEMDPKKNEQIAKEALPVKSNTFSTLAKRPKNTKLSINKIKYSFLLTCPDWKSLLKLCLSEL